MPDRSTLASGSFDRGLPGAGFASVLSFFTMTVCAGFLPSGVILDKSTFETNSSFFGCYFGFGAAVAVVGFEGACFTTGSYWASSSCPKSAFSSICFYYKAAIASSSLYTSGSGSALTSAFFGATTVVLIYVLPSNDAIALLLKDMAFMVS
jgi:hypothetical protein